MKNNIQKRGYDAEQMVVEYVTKQGYRVVARNYTTSRAEVDIIAQKDDVVAFIEVKMRTSSYFDVSLVVNHAKQRKIITAAQHYIASHTISERVIRFDVALVQPSYYGAPLAITYIPNAFNGSESLS